ncbi:MAG: class I SAM-dependent methyltransferase, partial [Halobacteriales archaeon]
MSDGLGGRLDGQFGGGDPARDIWRALSVVVDTGGYLNLGYSGPGQSHLVGHPQRRLVDRVGEGLRRAGVSTGDRLVDLGCGRGGPLARLEATLGVDGVGVDLVARNLHLARARRRVDPPAVLRGDIRSLALATDALDAATSIDALVYVDDRRRVFEEARRVVRPGGVLAATDLLRGPSMAGGDPSLERFRATWGFAPLRDRPELEAAIEAADLEVEAAEDLTPYSLEPIRGWARRYRALRRGPARRLIDAAVERLGLDPAMVA